VTHEIRESVRAFVALDLDLATRERAASVARELRIAAGAPGATWVAATRMHVTLRFIAALPAEAIAPLGGSLAPLVDGVGGPFICPARVDAFPAVDRATIVVLELLDERGELARLARDIDDLVQTYGVPRDERTFRPHVTLARLKRLCDASRWIRQAHTERIGECRMSSLTLFRSHPAGEGPTYEALATVRVGG
jgi:RNA 2',3'-cyclic 3'-phosphodiesterase